MVGSTGKWTAGCQHRTGSSLRGTGVRCMARASPRSRAWRSLLRKRPKQRAAASACSVQRLVFLISAHVGHASCSWRLSVCWFVQFFLFLSRPRVLRVLEQLFHIRADRCLTAAFPELHFRLLSIRV